MPEAGFLQQIKSSELKVLTEKSYKEVRTLHKSLRADVDMWLKYSCKHQGEYYITAIVAKEDVQYVEGWYPKKAYTLKNLRRFCGKHKKIVLLEAINRFHYTVSADKRKTVVANITKGRWHVYCGDVRVKYGRSCYSNRCQFHDEVNNQFENFMAIRIRNNKLEDNTADFWLELTKSF